MPSITPRAGGASGFNSFLCIYPGTTQTVSYTGTAGVITNAVASGVSVVRVYVTTDAFIKFGAAPTATTSDVFVKAGSPELFMVKAGDKVSAVQSASGGTLYVTEGAPS